MNLTQSKITKKEWKEMESPTTPSEHFIHKLIISGSDDVNINMNKSLSLVNFLKLKHTDSNDTLMYCEFLHNELSKACEHEITEKVMEDKSSIKKRDVLRLNHMRGNLKTRKKDIFEFVVISLVSKMYKHKKKDRKRWVYYYITISKLLTFNIQYNRCFAEEIRKMINLEKHLITVLDVISLSKEIFENNDILTKYSDFKLYTHQKDLFTYCKSKKPKLIQYIAPTGTGKTLSPLGLSRRHRVVFVCAARHVGLSLARSAISSNKRVAFAFGCDSPEDIRLHYFSAKEYSVNRRSGGIGKVDNMVGDNVEIMISDLKSYIHAMYYMFAFNKKEDLILYWDEPTITMDYEYHDFHEMIKQNWQENLIPNVVLASATLPSLSELQPTICDFQNKFLGAEIRSITSYEFSKSISCIDKEGYISMPHYLAKSYKHLQSIVTRCNNNRTMLRYFDLGEVIKFIKFISEHEELVHTSRYLLSNQFECIFKINTSSIKENYLDLISHIKESNWELVQEHFNQTRTIYLPSSIHFASHDAHTLTTGPSIFLTNDVDRIARFSIQEAKFPNNIIDYIRKSIKHNNKINGSILELQKRFEDGTNEDCERKMTNERFGDDMKKLLGEINTLNKRIHSVSLSSVFVPNSQEHLEKFCKGPNSFGIPFTSDITESTVNEVMRIHDADDWLKLLLFMGIGVFSKDHSKEYTEIMKSLAEQQKLFLVIASSDFIYGTNYQFCHGYIGNDLQHMTQDKCVQAMGRIGRSQSNQHYTVRFRNNDLIEKLFSNVYDKIESRNMAILFNS